MAEAISQMTEQDTGKETDLKGRIVQAAIAYRRADSALKMVKLAELNEAIDKLLKLPSRQFQISRHAISRYMTRAGCKTEKRATRKLKEMLNRAQETELKKEHIIFALLNHSLQDARYFRDGAWMLVVCNDVVVTCYKADKNRWK